MVARYGGEEFVILLKDISEENVKKIALNLLQSIRELQISHEYSKVEQIITISIGVAYKTASSLINKIELLICADEALYDVKRTSRNSYHIINV